MSVFNPKTIYADAPQMPYSIVEVDSKKDLDLFYEVTDSSRVCSVDTETTSQLDTKGGKEYYDWAQGARAFMATFCSTPDFVFATYDPDIAKAMLNWVDLYQVRQVYQNVKFDGHHLREWANYEFPKLALIDDDMYGFRLKYPGQRAGLKIASKRFVPPHLVDGVDWWQKKVHEELKRENGLRAEGTFWYNATKNREANFSDVKKEIMLPYAAHDAYLTLRSYFGLKETGILETSLYRQEVDLSVLLVRVEKAGSRVDRDELARQIAHAGEQFKNAFEKFRFLCPTVDPFSNTQLAEYMYNELGEEVVFQTEKGNPAVNEMAMYRIRNIAIRDSLLATKRWHKHLTTLTSLKKFVANDGCIHSNLKADAAKTGRFGSENPNMQNNAQYVKAKSWTHTRKIFKPEEGYAHLYADYKQIEVVLFADYSQDPILCTAIRNNDDVHAQTTGRMFGLNPLEVDPDSPTHVPEFKPLRKLGKQMTFTIQYGAGIDKIAFGLKYGEGDGEGVVSQEMVNKILGKEGTHKDLANFLKNSWKKGLPVASEYMKQVTRNLESRRPNPWIRNKFGRIIPVGNGYEYKGLNYLIQGTAADLMKNAMLRTWIACEQFCEEHNLIPWVDVQLFGTIHDELIFKVPISLYRELAKTIEPAMCDWGDLFTIPIRASFSVALPTTSWAEKEEFKLVA